MKIGKRILGAVAAVTLCAAAPTVAQVPIPDARVSLRVDHRSLNEVVQYLRDQSGYNIVVVDGGDTEITLDLTDVGWDEALELAAELAGCVVEERTAGVLAVARPPRVDFAFDNADIRQVIDTIAKLSGANIVVAPEVAGTLSLRLTDVPWRDALDVSVKTLGYTTVEEERGILRVVDPLSLQAQMETRSYQLRYVRPPGNYIPVIESEFLVRTSSPKGQQSAGGQQDYAKTFPVIGALKKALSPGGDLDYIAEQNILIVRDTAQVHAQIQSMLDRLDTEPAQVFVDVKFVSTSNGDVFALGVDYGDLGPQIGLTGGQIPVTLPFDLGSGGWDDWLIASPNGEGPFTFSDPNSGNAGNTVVPDTIFGALSFTQVAATLRMLQRDSRTEVVQAPKIIALDGREATIFVGETIRYAEAKSEQGQAGGLQLSVQEAGSSPVEVGFQLLIVPHVIPGTNKLTMDVIPKETSLSGVGDASIAPPGFDVFTVGASGLEGSIALPRKRSSTIVTSMLLDSGQTAVIGGLTTDSEVERVSEVPFLSKIPLLGWLFRFEDSSHDKRNLMVFITPTVVRSAGETQRLVRRELDQRRSDYGERLESILYGSTGDASYDSGASTTSMAAPPASAAPVADGWSADQDASEAGLRWGTFVEDPVAATESPDDQE